MGAETVAQAFHEAYERLAPSFGYKTREASAVPWEDVPENNRRLMVAVAEEVVARCGEREVNELSDVIAGAKVAGIDHGCYSLARVILGAGWRRMPGHTP